MDPGSDFLAPWSHGKVLGLLVPQFAYMQNGTKEPPSQTAVRESGENRYEGSSTRLVRGGALCGLGQAQHQSPLRQPEEAHSRCLLNAGVPGEEGWLTHQK